MSDNTEITETICKKLGSELIGFEYLIDQIIKIRTNATYPPFNIEITENGFKITIAVAGFSQNELKISLEHMQLCISGIKPTYEDQKSFIYKGIASRSFQKSFLLAEGMFIESVDLENGLLEIIIKKPHLTTQSIEFPIGYKNQVN